MRAFELRAWFEKVLQRLEVIEAKVSSMPQVQVQVTSKFQPTINALAKLGKPASASTVSQITGRHRAAESAFLNELAGRGVVTKQKQSRTCLFKLRDGLEGQTVDC
jgi:hypothetical protein